MPGTRCAVFGCKNTYKKREENNENFIFHRFPKGNDSVSQKSREEWIKRCKRPRKFNPDTRYICSIHFTVDDYERDLQNELLGLPLRTILKKTAIPTLHLYNKQPTQELNTAISEPDLPDEIPDYKAMYTEQLNKNKNLEKKYHLLKSGCGRKIKNLYNQLRYFKVRCRQLPILQKFEAPYNLLRTVLTQNQVDLLSNTKKRVNWTREEIAVAFILRYYSKKCYLFLKTKLYYPLPALSSLRKWASQLNLTQGILSDVLLMLKLAGESFSDLERTVVLQYNEMKVKRIEEYNTAQDEVLGPHNYLQIVMARGLFCDWKQPVFMAFDKKITPLILYNIIIELHKIKYNVVACVSDCHPSNVGLWKELGVDVNHTSFKHPVNGNNVYMFVDAPHLLKLLRNWLLDKGFLLKDNIILHKEPLQALVGLTNTEVNSCWKINQKHLDVDKTNRQNVRLAAELLSNSVATGLLRYKPGYDKEMAENLGEFISNINMWFDIFNSYTADGSVPSKNAYGTDLEIQKEQLNKIYKMISSMKVVGKNTPMIFQKGILMSISSLQLLFDDMESKMGIRYICTHKLNQDALKNFFFQIGSGGGPNEHPSPLSAINRARMILLGKNPGILDSDVNTEEKVIEEYISPKVLATAQISIEAEEIFIDLNESQHSSSFSSVSSSASKIPFYFDSNYEEITKDALEYISGYLAKKYEDVLPNLGDFTHTISQEHSYHLPSWVQQFYYGDLIKPSREFFKKIKTWNLYFEAHHGESFRNGPGVVNNLAKKIFKKEQNYPLKLIKSFCQLRTIIRINFRNFQAKYDTTLKRKASGADNNRKKIRKLTQVIIN